MQLYTVYSQQSLLKAMKILLNERFSNEHKVCKLVSGILWFLTNNAGYCLYTPVLKNWETNQ